MNDQTNIFCEGEECEDKKIPLIRDTDAEECVMVCPRCKHRCVLVDEKLSQFLVDNLRPIGTTELFSCLNCRQIYANKPISVKCSSCGATLGFHKSKLM